MEVLVLGSNGRLGKILCPFLKDAGHTVYELFRIRDDKGCPLHNNICLDNLFKNKKIDAIINLIALTDLEKCENDISSAYKSNVQTMEKLISSISLLNIHLIHISTDQVYSGEGPHKEDNVSPVNVYGLTKYISEKIANSLNTTILRTNYLGKSPLKNKKSLTDWLFQSFVNKSKINLYKNIFFSPLYVLDLCKYIEFILNHPIKGTFNLGSRGSISKAEFGLEFAKKLGLSIEKASISNYESIANLKRPLDMSLNSHKFEYEFKIKLPYIENTVNLIVDDYKKYM